jgi:hypothetical protein
MDVHQYINEPGISFDERSRRKTASHALIYGASPQRLAQMLAPRRFGFKKFGLGFMISPELLADDRYFTEALRRIRMQNLPLHLQPLDAGDLKFMKQMGWDEMEYRVWLFEEVEEKPPLKIGSTPVAASPEELRQAEGHGLEGPIRGRHYDRIIADDIGEVPQSTGGFLGRASFAERTLGRPPGLAAPYGQASPQQPPSQLPASVIQMRRNQIMNSKEYLQHCYDVMMKTREVAQNTPPTDASYHSVLQEVYDRSMSYLEAAQQFLNQTSINVGMPDIGNGPAMAGAQAVGRG